jgi:hypothetical protein
MRPLVDFMSVNIAADDRRTSGTTRVVCRGWLLNGGVIIREGHEGIGRAVSDRSCGGSMYASSIERQSTARLGVNRSA